MNNNELLLAISDMMDKKLDAVHVRLDSFETKFDAVEVRLSADIHTLDTKIDSVEEKLSADIRKINISLENVVIPRIKHIEQCYLSTSERYINESGRIDGLTFDIQVIKSIVQDHSQQLQKIS